MALTQQPGQFGRLAELAGVGITRIGDGHAVKVNLVQNQA